MKWCVPAIRPMVLIGILFALVTSVHAGESAATFPPDIAGIRERGTLRVAMLAEDVPYFFKADKSGTLIGFDIELARALAESLEVKLTLVRSAHTYEEVVSLVQNKQADMAISILSKTPARSQRVLMSRPYAVVHPTVAVNRLRLTRMGPNISGREALNKKGIKIAALNGSSYVKYAKWDFPDAEVVQIDGLDACWQAVMTGEVLAFYFDEIEIKSRLRQDQYMKLDLEVVMLEEVNDLIAVAVAHDAYNLHDFVDTYLLLNYPEVLTADQILARYRDPDVPEILAAEAARVVPPAEKWKVAGAAAGVFFILFLLYWRKRAQQPLDQRQPWGKLLLSPLAILAGVVSGAIIGIYFKPVAVMIKPLGGLYMSLLQMVVLPVIIVAVVNSLGLLLSQGDIAPLIRRLLLVVVVALLCVAGLGTLTAGVTQVGRNIGTEARNELGTFLEQHEQTFSAKGQPAAQAEPEGLWSFLNSIVPENVFVDLVAGNNLSILFFSIILGVALSFAPKGRSEVFAVTEALYSAFDNIIQWLMYGLPIGMCCILASQFVNLGLDLVLGAAGFILLVYILIGIVMLVSSLIIWRISKQGYLDSLNALRKALFVGFGNGRPISSIPMAIDGMVMDLGFNRRMSRLVIPLTFNTISFGNILHFAVAGVFLANLYGVSLSIEQYGLILVTSIMAGIAASAAPGVLALPMIAIVLTPLQLPVAPSLALLFAIDPLLDQPLTLASVHANCACNALISTHEGVGTENTRSTVEMSAPV